MGNKKSLSVFILLIGLILVSCQAKPLSPGRFSELWKYGDLRLLDPVDSGSSEQDVIALYSRNIDNHFQIRIDFLDLISPVGQDIYIPIDIYPGGHKEINQNGAYLQADIDWDILIIIPSSGSVKIINNQYSPIIDVELFINRNITQDDIVITFTKSPKMIIWNRSTYQILVTAPGRMSIVDEAAPVRHDSPPPDVSKIMFVFWNAFNSRTPAETLRSWDGAHSGPMRTRHGLKYLLLEANKYKIPLFFLGLLTEDNFSAFDFIDQYSYINKLIEKEIIKKLPGREKNEYKDYFIIKDGSFYKLLGVFDYANNKDFSKNCPLSLISPNAENSSPNLSINCKEELLSNNFTQNKSISYLGGDFSKSLLGNPDIAANFFLYIYYHPWIQVLPDNERQDIYFSADDQENKLITEKNYSEIYNSFSQFQLVYSDLQNLSKNQITTEAQRIFSMMVNQQEDKQVDLASNYVGQIGYLITASKWLANPFSISGCDYDLNYDGENECILSTNKMILFVNPKGGYIPFLFYLDNGEIHQIIGPTWEYILGISDPSEWDNIKGVLSDNKQVLGAFEDNHQKWNSYEPSVDGNTIILSDFDGNTNKSFSILDERIHIVINTASQKFDLPIVIDPWLRYSRRWAKEYVLKESPENLSISYRDFVHCSISSNTKYVVNSFLDSYPKILSPEDPNYDYPLGHYLPYPIILLEYQPAKELSIDIIVNKN